VVPFKGGRSREPRRYPDLSPALNGAGEGGRSQQAARRLRKAAPPEVPPPEAPTAGKPEAKAAADTKTTPKKEDELGTFEDLLQSAKARK
jgi:hypothetical protein